LVNDLVKIDYAADQGGRAASWYIAGRFDLQPDEAFILELDPGDDCRYWSLHLGDELSRTLDLYNRVVSTNGHFAHPDDDGVFRIVVSAKDPGVWNSMDTIGHQKGFLWGRMDRVKEYEPKIARMNVNEIFKHLPAGTRRATPEERDALIRHRRIAAQLRRRW
jgi:hypothetical protein